MRTKIFIIFLCLAFVLTTGLSCARGGTQEAKQAMESVRLTFWSVYDDSDAYGDIIADYRALHPNVTIEYRKFRYEEYEDELIEAFALDEGPDIFSVHNTWTDKYLDLLEPMPSAVQLPFQKVVGTVKKEQVVELVTQQMYTAAQVRKLFGDTVADDIVRQLNVGTQREPNMQNKIFGLPIALDTLALYYNKDILNNAGIALPAQYWTDIQAQIEGIRKIDDEGNILLAAIPMGTAENVVRSFDILSLIMMQLKTEMVNDRGSIVFNDMPAALSGQEAITQPPGVNALEFYTSFADPLLTSYTWNSDMLDSLNAFITGKTAYFIGYSYHRPTIQAQAPKLNFDIAPMLQVQGYDSVNYANYWINSVSKKSDNKSWAWDFVRFMSTQDEAIKYLAETQKPAALRSLYDKQINNDDIAVFAEQTLTAKSWYRGLDSNAAEDIFAEMIASVNQGVVARQAIDLAARKMQQTWK